MSLATFWYQFKLLNLSRPAEDRPLFRAVKGRKIQSILEVGLGDGSRTVKLLEWLKFQGITPTRYAAIDPFESGGSGHLSLKEAHKLISSHGLRPCFVPGEFATAVHRVLHTIGPCDLVILADASLHPSQFAQPDLIGRVVAETGILLARDAQKRFAVVPRPAVATATRRAA